jgi:hypothetical protein
MLRIYESMLDVLRMLRPVIAQIEKHDRDLGNQLRRASTSVPRAAARAGARLWARERDRARGSTRPDDVHESLAGIVESRSDGAGWNPEHLCDLLM